MTKAITIRFSAVAMALAGLVVAEAQAKDLVVAFSPQWPLPYQYAQAHKIYDKELGVTVRWVALNSGTEMSAAMASGDVQISMSHDKTAFVEAVSAGQDLKAIDIAVTYSDNDNCVLGKGLKVSGDNPDEIEGMSVGIPIGTSVHRGFLAQMTYFGVDTSRLKIRDMAPVDAVAALADGEIDMACGWGGPLRRMMTFGDVLIPGERKERITGKVYDLVSTVGSWARKNPDLVAGFLKVTHDMNRRFDGERGADMIAAIADMAGQDQRAVEATMTSGMKFISSGQALSEDWMAGYLPRDFKAVSSRLAGDGKFKPLESYEDTVDSRYLKASKEL